MTKACVEKSGLEWERVTPGPWVLRLLLYSNRECELLWPDSEKVLVHERGRGDLDHAMGEADRQSLVKIEVRP